MTLKNILLATNLDDGVEDLSRAALAYAAAFKSKVFVVHIAAPQADLVGYPKTASDLDVDEENPIGWEYDRKLLAEKLRGKHKAVQEVATHLEQQGCAAEALLIEGAFVETLLSEVDRLHIDLVIIGSHEPSALSDLFFGNMAKEVIGRITCPVLVVPPLQHTTG
jgi:nucleotide-binding universal stress UspA family protein